ncbi:hypothetical protein D3C84_1102320 [compost metagenome]
MDKSLRIQSTAKPKSKAPSSMVWWRCSCCQDCAAPLLITSIAAVASSPAHCAKCKASASPCKSPPTQIWLTILVSWPLPTGPIRRTILA